VRRERMVHDGRRQLVVLTQLGLERVRAAVTLLLDSLIADRLAARALAFDNEVAYPQLRLLQELLSTMRRNLGDPSPYPHPWTSEPLATFLVNTMVDGRIAYGDALM
jgi:hypothetical protein